MCQRYGLGCIQAIGISWIELDGNQEQLHKWLEEKTLPVRLVYNTLGVHAFGIGMPNV
jgi:hypothetical protein